MGLTDDEPRKRADIHYYDCLQVASLVNLHNLWISRSVSPSFQSRTGQMLAFKNLKNKSIWWCTCLSMYHFIKHSCVVSWWQQASNLTDEFPWSLISHSILHTFSDGECITIETNILKSHIHVCINVMWAFLGSIWVSLVTWPFSYPTITAKFRIATQKWSGREKSKLDVKVCLETPSLYVEKSVKRAWLGFQKHKSDISYLKTGWTFRNVPIHSSSLLAATLSWLATLWVSQVPVRFWRFCSCSALVCIASAPWYVELVTVLDSNCKVAIKLTKLKLHGHIAAMYVVIAHVIRVDTQTNR